MSSAGTHGLHCRRSAGRFARHAAINEVISRSLCAAQIPARREPVGLYTTQTRPDGKTLVPWRLGKCMAWDATVVDTLAPSHVVNSASEAGYSARLAELRKVQKYAGNRLEFEIRIKTITAEQEAGRDSKGRL